MKDFKFNDPELVLLCAFRYALGRRTYVPRSIIEEIYKNWDNLDIVRKKQIQKEILDHERLFGTLGDSCDINAWHTLIDKIDEEINSIKQ